MVTISNSQNLRSYGRSGMLGLATGMDTESVIEGMLQPTQYKIDKQLGIKQQMQWKQDIYRSLMTRMTTLQRNYFDALNPKTNLTASSFYSSKSVSSSSSAVSATASQFAPPSLTIQRVSQLAKGTTISSHQAVSQDIRFNIQEDVLLEESELTFTLDGVSKTISLTKGTPNDVLHQLQEKLNLAFGNGIVVESDGTLKTNHQRQLTVGGKAESLQGFGLSSAQSNFVSMNASLHQVNFTKPLIGEEQVIAINGIEITLSSTDTVSTMINRINQSQAGVIASYSTVTDTFTLTSKTMGQGVPMTIEDVKGNLGQVLFQTGTTSSVSGKSLSLAAAIESTMIDPSSMDFGSSWTMSVNGTTHTFTLPSLEEEEVYTTESAIIALNKEFEKTFGKNAMVLSAKSENQFELQSFGKKVEFDDTEGLHKNFGFSDITHELSINSRLSDVSLEGQLNVNGVMSTFDETSTIQDLITFLEDNGMTASFDEGRIHLASTESVTLTDVGNMLRSLFGNSMIELNGTSELPKLTDGQNAILEVNGITIERNSNQFELEHYRLSLNELTEQPVTLSSKSNLDDVISGIKGFIDEYNELIEEIHRLTQEKTEFRDYPPLSEAQKKDMSEKEVELWESKAKTGLVRNDATLVALASSMRQILFETPAGSLISLADLGITTGNHTQRGRLSIDETKLRQKLEEDPQSVAQLFTDRNSGVAVRFNQALNSAIRPSLSQPGSLVRLAGVANTSSAVKNQLSERMVSIDRMIENLRRTYESQKERYWKQFSRLESVISKMNSQSSWLQQQLG